MKYDFIEIGTSDFRYLGIDPNKVGISVEPVPEYYNRLKLGNKQSIKVNVAISGYNATGKMHSCKSEVIESDKLPNWLRGCNSFGEHHPSVADWCKENNYPYTDLVKVEEVEVRTLRWLFDEFKVTEVDLLKIDTEGHDSVIMNFLANLIEHEEAPSIGQIQFESNTLMNALQLEEIKARFKHLGYSASDVMMKGNQDTILTYER